MSIFDHQFISLEDFFLISYNDEHLNILTPYGLSHVLRTCVTAVKWELSVFFVM